MKITHNKEHCFLAVWVLQQYGNHPRVADADDENDDARDSSRTGHLPKELVRKIVEYLMCPQTLEIEFDLAAEGDVEALRGTVDFLCNRDPALRWGSVYLGLNGGKKVVVRNRLDFPNMDNRGTVLFANVVDDAEGPMVGEDPRLRDGGLVLLRSEMSDGPPRVQEAEVESYRHRVGNFSVCCLIEAALKTKSHKADGWYEMYGGVKINTTDSEDAVFLDLDFDYGS